MQCKALRFDATAEEPDSGHCRVNGTQIWTTHAQWANKIFCLVRTGSAAKSQQGISCLRFDMRLPGITVRPIISLSGDHELNQVFLDDVRLPLLAVLGEESHGWPIAKYL